MDTLKRQASKLREQVAKQQQEIMRHLGHLGNEAVMVDDAELQCYQQLQNLYISTRAAKHFQREIVRGVEGFILASKRQMEIARRLAEDCCKYGTKNQTASSPLSRAAMHFGNAYSSIEDKRVNMIELLGDQVSEPLRASITGAPLEDARHLTHRYDKLRQEVESQAAEVLRRQSKYREPSSESDMKLKSAEAKLTDLKSSMRALGREAMAAMLSVEDQQQQITFQRLLNLVDAERYYHQKVVAILEKLHTEMILEKQLNESSSQSASMQRDMHVRPAHEDYRSEDKQDENENNAYFIAKVIHSFDAQTDGELTLAVDDYVVVRQVADNGWSEGECKGKAGWFPSAYVERQDKVPASKIIEEKSLP